MKILIDTNVVIDVLIDRKPFADNSSAVLKLCEANKIKGFITATTVTDIYYILSKAVSDKLRLYTILEKVLLIVDICDITKQNILNAIKLREFDFEDAVQSEGAIAIGADYIVTRNIKDFANSKVEAITPLFVVASALIWLGNITGLFGWLINAVKPIVNLIGLPGEASEAFIFGFFRRDFGAAGLYDLQNSGALSPRQLVVAASTLTLFVPCVAQFTMMIKEKGAKVAIAMAAFIFPFAFFAGFVLNWILVTTGLLV